MLLVSTDLMATSKVDAAARLAGVACRSVGPAGTVESALADLPGLIAIDLTAPIKDLAGLVSELRKAAPTAELIAFGPHVHQAKLDAAEAAGCDRVMPRGAFHKGLDALLAKIQ